MEIAQPREVITLLVSSVEFGSFNLFFFTEFVLNTKSKPMICVLHEYAQRVLKTQPQYIFHTRGEILFNVVHIVSFALFLQYYFCHTCKKCTFVHSDFNQTTYSLCN